MGETFFQSAFVCILLPVLMVGYSLRIRAKALVETTAQSLFWRLSGAFGFLWGVIVVGVMTINRNAFDR